MDKSIIKNFILILLLLVNVFLLIIVITNFREERKAELYRKEALEQVLSDNNITLDPNIELPEKVPPQVSLRRDLDIEEKQVSSLLGNCSVQNQGGNIYTYNGSEGIARFRGTGEFEILYYNGISKGKDPVGAAKVVLKKLGIEYSDEDSIIENDGENTSVTLFGSWDGTPIYNSKINFDFISEYQMLISGSRPLDIEYSVQSTENYPDSITRLMNFLKTVRDTGEVCNEIKDMRIEYFLTSAVSGDCTLKPVWSIVTNSKTYYIDAKTGEAENIESVS